MRLWPYGIVAAVGLVLAVGAILTADRDPLAWALPITVATCVVLLVAWIADRRDDERASRRAARETGLEYDGIRPLPAVTSILRDVTEPAHVVSGDLDDGEELAEVRVATVRRHLVAIADAPAGGTIDGPARAWLGRHPLSPRAEIEDGLLVVAVDRDAPPPALLEIVGELRRTAARAG